MSAPTISEFSAEVSKRNIARTNLYYVEILPPPGLQTNDSRLVSLFCSAASTPHAYLLTNDNYIEAGVRRKFAYDIDFQNLVLNFYIDQGFKVKQFFDEWKHLIVPYHRRFNYPDNYTAESLNVYIIDMTDSNTYKYEYSRVFPKTINSIELNSASGTTTAQLNVEFTFEDVYFTALGKSEFSTSKPLASVEAIKQNITNLERTQALNPKQRN